MKLLIANLPPMYRMQCMYFASSLLEEFKSISMPLALAMMSHCMVCSLRKA